MFVIKVSETSNHLKNVAMSRCSENWLRCADSALWSAAGVSVFGEVRCVFGLLKCVVLMFLQIKRLEARLSTTDCTDSEGRERADGERWKKDPCATCECRVSVAGRAVG